MKLNFSSLMKETNLKILILIISMLISLNIVFAQTNINGIILNEDNEPVQSATVKLNSLSSGKQLGVLSDENGSFHFTSLEPGLYQLNITYVGYKTYDDTISVPLAESKTIEIKLESTSIEKEDVVISASRTNRTISDVPVRVELIPSEEIEEGITMLVSSSKMLLGELPGVMAQTVSSNLGASTIRLRGLDGRYTQILLDGIPAFGGLNLNSSILQLPVLNLKQLEVIKGTAGIQSDAIAGIINFITRTASSESPEGVIIANYTSQNGFDFAEWVGKKYGDFGITLHSTYSSQERYDVDADGYADVPLQRRLVINPRISYESENGVKLYLSGGYTNLKRLGGLMSAANDLKSPDSSHYSSSLMNERLDIYSGLNYEVNANNTIVVNLALSRTDRNSFDWLIPFSGIEMISYADAQWSGSYENLSLLAGVVVANENFKETSTDSLAGKRDFEYSQFSGFTQLEWKLSDEYKLLGFIRLDNHNKFDFIAVPRVTIMYKPMKSMTIRGSVGNGWRAANIFDESAENIGYKNVSNMNINIPEKSFGTNIDFKYELLTENEWIITSNLNVFYSVINDRIELDTSAVSSTNGTYIWYNAGKLSTMGTEIIIQVQKNNFTFNAGYTFNTVKENDKGLEIDKLLTPKHFINANLKYEISHTIRILVETMFMSSQLLPQNDSKLTSSPNIFTLGLSAEYWLNKGFSVFINFENLLDYRQTKYTKAYIGTPGMPGFNSGFVWATLEGRVINGGIKYSF